MGAADKRGFKRTVGAVAAAAGSTGGVVADGAASAGVVLSEDTSGAAARRKQRAGLLDAVSAAEGFYHQRLLSAPDAGPARRPIACSGDM